MKMLARAVPWLALCLALPTLASPQEPASATGASDGGRIRILMMMGNHVGGYHYFTRDLWEQAGWDLTAAGLAPDPPALQPGRALPRGHPAHADHRPLGLRLPGHHADPGL